MSLEKWAEFGWLRKEKSSADEIRGLFAIVTRDLHDAEVSGVSEDRRFEAAFSAARTCANIALRASGYRTTVQAGHHQKTIESLEFTMMPDPNLIQKLKVLSKKRNATSYDAAGNVSADELEQANRIARDLQKSVTLWLKKNHPELQ